MRKNLPGPAMWIAVAAASALCYSLLNSRQRASPFFAASNTSSGSISRNRRRIDAVAHDAFQWPRPPQPQKRLLLIERHDRVAALPHARGKRIAP